jgi:hypothetical protein
MTPYTWLVLVVRILGVWVLGRALSSLPQLLFLVGMTGRGFDPFMLVTVVGMLLYAAVGLGMLYLAPVFARIFEDPTPFAGIELSENLRTWSARDVYLVMLRGLGLYAVIEAATGLGTALAPWLLFQSTMMRPGMGMGMGAGFGSMGVITLGQPLVMGLLGVLLLVMAGWMSRWLARAHEPRKARMPLDLDELPARVPRRPAPKREPGPFLRDEAEPE